MFESVREFLTAAAAGSGLVLLFDDVHWADPPSLRLLRHLAEGVAASRLLLLITYRDTETGGRDELTAFLAALARQDAVTRITLTGLTQDEVARQLAVVTGDEVAPEVAAAIGRRSHGNPFFVGELARVLDAGSSVLPDAVRDTVRVRLHGLSSACQDVLGAAAVLGTAVDPAAVTTVTGRETAAVLAALDEAAAAGIVAAGSFGHDLIREVARLELPTADRLAVHARMAGYLRRQPEVAPALVAYHLLESLPVGSADQARTWAEAARAAMEQLAWEDAAAWYERALRVPGAPDTGPWIRPGGAGCCSAWPWPGCAASTCPAAAPRCGRRRRPRSAGDPALVAEVARSWRAAQRAGAGVRAGEFGRAFRLADECLRLAAHGHENMRSLTAAVVVRLNAVTGRDEWLPASMADFSWSPPFGLAMRALWHLALGRVARRASATSGTRRSPPCRGSGTSLPTPPSPSCGVRGRGSGCRRVRGPSSSCGPVRLRRRWADHAGRLGAALPGPRGVRARPAGQRGQAPARGRRRRRARRPPCLCGPVHLDLARALARRDPAEAGR